MTQLYLIRHAQNDWMRSGRLAGWIAGVHLNEEGQQQAAALGERLAVAKLQAVYSSPLERAVETAQAILAHYPALTLNLEPAVGEVQYGDWEGQRLRKLARTRLWQVVQQAPSQARFPAGESIREMQFRAVSALERIAAEHPGGVVAVVSHADVIKAVLAHFSGVHLDHFQRIVIGPASISVVFLGHGVPRVMRINDAAHCEGLPQRGA